MVRHWSKHGAYPERAIGRCGSFSHAFPDINFRADTTTITPSCYIIATSWSDSPVSTHFRALSRELVRRGHRVVLLVDQNRHDVENHDSNPAVYTWPSPRPTKVRDAIFLARLVYKYRPKCFIANFGAENIMMIAGWLFGVACRVVWYHTMSRQLDIDHRSSKWLFRLLMWRKRIVYALATHCVANSKASRCDLQRVYRVPDRKCRVFYWSLQNPVGSCNLPNRLIMPHRTLQPRVVCAGRFDRSKGQDVLIRAAAILRSSQAGIAIEFLGDGPCKSDLVLLARTLGVDDLCTFRGAVSHDDVLSSMADAIATVVPSRSEAFGLVNIESMALGTPVVASAVDGIVELFRDGEEGFLVPPDDPAALADRLERLLLNPELRCAMSANARKRFAEFDQNKAVANQADWLERIGD